MTKVVCVVGTRPEVVKMAPVIRMFRERYPKLDCRILVTAQHRDMLDQMLRSFELKPDWDLNLMTDGQSLSTLTANLFGSLDHILRAASPDILLVQGDTTTALVAAMAAFYHRVPVGHVEAGLRSGNRYNPFPEELNRTLIARLSTLHFVPHVNHRGNLIAEGIAPSTIFLTGNTVLDALDFVLRENAPRPLAGEFDALEDGQALVLITLHRRESFGAPMRGILQAIGELVDRHSKLQIVFPVHRNPHVRALVHDVLGGKSRVLLRDPLDYPDFIAVMARSRFVLTDSGGVQEEAPALGKPVLVVRDTTERPEIVTAGAGLLVGTSRERIVAEASRLLTDESRYQEMARATSPYGVGIAAERITTICARYLDGTLDLGPCEITIIVPARNEAENLPDLIAKIDHYVEERGWSAELLVVNDCSTDNSQTVLDELALRYARLHPIHKGPPGGIGYAIRQGIAEARGVMAIVTMADGSDDIERFADLRRCILEEGYDLAVASRYLRAQDKRNIPLLYKFLSWWFRHLGRFLAGVPLADLTNAYRAFRLSVVRDVGLQAGGFEVSPEITFRIWFRTGKVTEVTSTHLKRSKGESHFSFVKAGPGYLIVMIKAIFARLTGRWIILDW